MPRSEDRDRGSPIQVLLIDDDEDSVIIIGDVLEQARRHDYEISWCSDPRNAAQVLRESNYDVCLLDFHFGAHDGLEFLKEIRALGITVPIIMFTGQKNLEVEWEAARFGADDYLDKDDLTPALLERMIYFAIERRQTQAELVKMAKTDALTGASNRIGLYEYIDQARVRAQRHNREFAVLVLDLDRFKQMNDQNGHAFGDTVLVNVVATLKRYVRESDLIARIGGDEFVVVLDDVDGTDGARRVMHKILELLRTGFAIDGRPVAVEASIGMALWPRDGDTIDALLAKADASMYAHKRSSDKRSIPA